MKPGKPLLLHWCLILLLPLAACRTKAPMAGTTDDGLIAVQLLQINDVYEIGPLEGGKVGGMSRVAGFRKQLLAQNPNTLTVHAGDFLSPSLLGALRYQGSRIKGRQMVEAMNEAGVDLVTFGNHEFDLDENELQDRLNQSKFRWVSSNVHHQCGDYHFPFYSERPDGYHPVEDTWVWDTRDADGTRLRVGFFGLTLPSNPKDFVRYEDYTAAARRAVNSLKDQCDCIVGLTHLELEQDIALAPSLSEVTLFAGGHDHTWSLDSVGTTKIAKADANAKTAWVHTLHFDRNTKRCRVAFQLKTMDNSVPQVAALDSIVARWDGILDATIREVVAEPYEVIFNATEPLDGREKSIRNEATNLGGLIARAFRWSAGPEVELAVFNSGGIRIDDEISGDVTAIDIFRVLPFGGSLWRVTMKGELLQQLLNTGLQNKGNGGFLQMDGVSLGNSGSWLINGQALDINRNYRLVTNDFLLSGKETNLGYLTETNPGIVSINKPTDAPDDVLKDMRRAIVAYLRSGRR